MQSLPLFVVLSFVAFASAHHGVPGSVDCYCNVYATTHTSLVLLANPHSHYTECSEVDKCKQECNTKWTKQFGGGNIGRSANGINGVSVGQQFCHTLAKQGKTEFGPYKVHGYSSLCGGPNEYLGLEMTQPLCCKNGSYSPCPVGDTHVHSHAEHGHTHAEHGHSHH